MKTIGKKAVKQTLRTLLKVLSGIALLGVVLWLGGMFAKPGIAPEVLAMLPPETAPTSVGTAQMVSRAVDYRAVGSIESSSRVQLTARIAGQLLELNAEVGDSVKRGDLLAVIDSRDAAARVAQARSGLRASEAQETQAVAAAKRARDLLALEAATLAQLEAAEAEAASATAGVVAARERVTEAEIGAGYARISAPMDGVVTARPVESGDMAWPGAPLFTLIDPDNLRIEAWVRESAFEHVAVGNSHTMQVPSRELELTATIDEIVPSADSRNRSFLVRASFDNAAGLYPGMFARLVIAAGARDVVEVERAAIRRIGQLDTTRVKTDSGWSRRYVTLGARSGDKVEVLSGLVGGETIGWSE